MTKEKQTIGKCIWCGSVIYADQPWEEIGLELNPLARKHIREGPIHKRCRVPYLKIIIGDLVRDIEGLEWLLEGYTKKREQNGSKTHNK